MHEDIDDLVWIFVFPCPSCNGKNTVWFGKRYGKSGIKSKRKCKDCKRIYTNQPPRAKGKKNTVETINLAIHIAKDHSLRETEKILKEKYGIKITYASISNWKKEFLAGSKEYIILPKKRKPVPIEKKKTGDEDDPDWMFKPILKTDTKTKYDGNKIDADWIR